MLPKSLIGSDAPRIIPVSTINITAPHLQEADVGSVQTLVPSAATAILPPRSTSSAAQRLVALVATFPDEDPVTEVAGCQTHIDSSAEVLSEKMVPGVGAAEPTEEELDFEAALLIEAHSIRPHMPADKVALIKNLTIRAAAIGVADLRQEWTSFLALVESVNREEAGERGRVVQDLWRNAVNANKDARCRRYLEKAQTSLVKGVDGAGPNLLFGEALALAQKYNNLDL